MGSAVKVDVAIIGAGTAGLYALSIVRRSGQSYVVIDDGPLGTMCARVGCMPSKALIQVADDFALLARMQAEGIENTAILKIDVGAALNFVREKRDFLSGRVRERTLNTLSDKLIRGKATFQSPTSLVAAGKTVTFKKAIVATGSEPVLPSSWREFGDRILTTDTLFEQIRLPGKIAVLGMGAIGLEVGQSLHRLGVKVTGYDLAKTIAGIQDPHILTVALESFKREFPIELGAPAQLVEGSTGGLRVIAGEKTDEFDAVLVCLGRRPRLADLALEKAGALLDKRGRPIFDPATMRIGDTEIYIAGDSNGDRVLFHEAADEGRIAAVQATQSSPGPMARKTPLAIVFADPNVATFGMLWPEAEQRGAVVGEAKVEGDGRAVVMEVEAGLIRLYGDSNSGRLLGGAVVSPRAEHMAHGLAWMVQAGQTVHDLVAMPYYHPTLEEAIFTAASDLARQCKGGAADVPFGLRAVHGG